MGESKVARKPVSKTEPVSKKPVRTTPVQAEAPRVPDLSLIGRQPLDANQVMHLQRTIGNAATNRLLGNTRQLANAPTSEPNPSVIQRFPSSADLKKRGDAASNETGFIKKTSQSLTSKKKSRYDGVIDLADSYNALVQSDTVEKEMGARLASYKHYSSVLTRLREGAQAYIDKHKKKGDRPLTVASFTKLLTEIEIEIDFLYDVYKEPAFDNNPKNPTWQAAIDDKIKGRDTYIVPLAADIGLSVDYLKTLHPAALKSINDVHRLLAENKLPLAEKAFKKLKTVLPEKTFYLIRSSLMRKHLDKINPELSKVINNPNFTQKSDAMAALGTKNLQVEQQAAKGPNPPKVGESTQGMATQYLSNFMGKGNLAADDAMIGTGAGFDEGVLRGVRSKAEFAQQFKDRQAWEKANVKESQFKNLKPHEQSAIAAYSLDYKEFSTPLRGDLTAGESQGQFNKSQQAKTENLISALNKLPPYTGMVYRHDGDFEGFLDYNRKGATVSDMAFYSTTREASTLRLVDGSPTPEVLTIIKSKTGRFIKPMSSYNTVGSKFTHDENEVLFNPGTRFKVTDSFKATKTAAGDLVFTNLPPWVKSVLDQDSEKKTVKVILIKEEG